MDIQVFSHTNKQLINKKNKKYLNDISGAV